MLIFSVPLFFLNVPGAHSLGDDFAQYIKEADNISKGLPYNQTNYIFNDLDKQYAPPQYPPGYPLLLAPVVKAFGIAIQPMLYLNALMLVALSFVLFAWFRKYAGVVAAVAMALIIVYSNVIIDAKGNVLSDLPCMLFVSLYLLLRKSETFSPGRIILLILTATMVILIRWQGLLIVAAEGIYFLLFLLKSLWLRRFNVRDTLNHISLKVVAGTLILFFLVNNVVFYSPQGTFSYYLTMSVHRTERLRDLAFQNLKYLFTLLSDLLRFPESTKRLRFISITFSWVAFGFAAAGFILSLRKPRVDDIFFLLMIFMVILLPVHQGPRVLFEIFPIYILYSYTAVACISRLRLPKLSPYVAVGSVAIFLLLGAGTYRRYAANECIGCVPGPVANYIFDYVKANVADSDIVVFPRPRLFTLYTNKKAVVYASNATDQENNRKFAMLNVKYFMPWFDKTLLQYMRRNYTIKDSVVVGDATLYRIR